MTTSQLQPHVGQVRVAIRNTRDVGAAASVEIGQTNFERPLALLALPRT
jgi:hypothetical protein